MTIDPRDRFSGAADAYARFRPSYPAALLDWIAAETGVAPPAAIADVGCGTGIAARLFAARGYEVVGVEPNADMLAEARAAGGGPRYVRADAAHTTLPAASIDLITVAQAFHWFDVPVALAELRRVLRPGGWCAAFWNIRVTSPAASFGAEYDALLRAHSADYRHLPGNAAAHAALVAAVGGPVREARFPNVLVFDEAALLGYAHSTSYVAHGVPDHAAFDADLRRLAERHGTPAGHVAMQLETHALLFA